MTTLTIMVGLPASGKSTIARRISRETDAVLLESDQHRDDVFQGRQDNKTNALLFEHLHKMAYLYLENKHDLVFDATNLSYKHRMTLLKKIRGLKNVKKVAHVVMTDVETCLQRNIGRKREVDERVIYRMRESFTMPQLYEGFDEINISSTFNKDFYTFQNLYDMTIDFNQENPNHTRTLWNHMSEVSKELPMRFGIVGLLHDVGKVYTKSFTKADRVTPTDIAHYFNHENVSAYESFFYLKNLPGYSDDEILYLVGLIQNHMRLYQCNTKKSLSKLINLVGNQMYVDLLTFNQADKMGK